MKYEPKEIFTSLDLELNQAPTGQKIIQIGAVVGNIRTGDILEKLSVFVNPHETLEPFIIQLTKITQEQVDGGVTLREAYAILKAMHEKHDSFVNPITWGGGDPIEILEELKKEDPTFHGWCFGRRWIDTKTLYISWRLANSLPPAGGLSRAMKNVGLAFRGHAHNATWDAENTFHMYRKMLSLFKNENDPKQTRAPDQQSQS